MSYSYIPEHWKQIAGAEFLKDGSVHVVWIAHDSQSDTIHLHDSASFSGDRALLPIVAEGLSSGKRWVPIAWEKKARPMVEKLRERGCNFTYNPHDDDDAVAEAIAADIRTRMLSGRFKADKHVAAWLDEFRAFNRADQKVPRDGFPLMTATRFACAMYDEWAKPERHAGAGRKNYPNVAVV